MASGMPSSRRQISSTTARSRRRAGSALFRCRRARSTKRSTHSSVRRAAATRRRCARPATPSRSRLVASTAVAGHAGQHRRRPARGRRQDVLAVVEEHERAAVAEVVDDGLDGILRRPGSTPSVSATAPAMGSPGGDGCQVDHPHAVAPLRRHVERELDGEPRLAHPAGPEQRDQPAGLAPARRARRPRRPARRTCRRGGDRLWPSAGTARNAWEPLARVSPTAVTWWSSAGAVEVAQPVGAEPLDPRSRRRRRRRATARPTRSPGPRCRRRRHGPPGGARGRCSRRPVGIGDAGVQAHPHPDDAVVRPRLGAEPSPARRPPPRRRRRAEPKATSRASPSDLNSTPRWSAQADRTSSWWRSSRAS